jgi:hypothetical protein
MTARRIPDRYDSRPTMPNRQPEGDELAAYAARLDTLVPDWFEDDETLMSAPLAAEALKRRKQ